MISVVLILEGCGDHAGIIVSTMQGTCSSFASNFVNTKPATKSFQRSVETDRYTLIEQSGNDPNWQIAVSLKTT